MIDDEKEFCYFVKQNLELIGGFQVVIANDGKGGIEAAAREKPDAILLDIIMPRMNGFEVLRELKKNKDTSHIPVIMLTAVDGDEAKEKAMSIFGEDYIVKPVEIEMLKSRINAVISRRL
jgi:DNA-binding response OmpR family regulator